jgi:hypothetical protein
VVVSPEAGGGFTVEKLALAIEISEIADEAASAGKVLDVQAEACRLVRKHLAAHVSTERVAQALAREVAAAGRRRCKVFVAPPPPRRQNACGSRIEMPDRVARRH